MVIFRIASNLIRMAIRLALFPLFLLTHNLFAVIVVVAGVLIYMNLSSDDHSQSSRNANPASMERNAKGQMVQVPSTVATVENGNSAFANDLYVQMTESERSYYSQIFFWVMGNVKDGQAHSWSNIDIGGMISPTSSFKNKVGDTCRQFSESLKVHAVQQQITGIACQKADGSWCKLSANATPACGLGHTPGMFEGITGSLKNIF
jgi:surface antigen